METTLKQRLIGAVVIIAIAVILIPMILDDPGQQRPIELDLEMPPEPEFIFESELPDLQQLDDLPAAKKNDVKQTPVDEKVELETPGDVEEMQISEAQASEAQASEAQTAKAQTAEVPTSDVVDAPIDHIKPNPSLNTWVVQAAAFGDKDKALALQEKLIAGNYPAFMEKSVSGNKAVYRVKVGPDLNRDDAEKLLAKIKKEYGLTGIFVTSHP